MEWARESTHQIPEELVRVHGVGYLRVVEGGPTRLVLSVRISSVLEKPNGWFRQAVNGGKHKWRKALPRVAVIDSNPTGKHDRQKGNVIRAVVHPSETLVVPCVRIRTMPYKLLERQLLTIVNSPPGYRHPCRVRLIGVGSMLQKPLNVLWITLPNCLVHRSSFGFGRLGVHISAVCQR